MKTRKQKQLEFVEYYLAGAMSAADSLRSKRAKTFAEKIAQGEWTANQIIETNWDSWFNKCIEAANTNANHLMTEDGGLPDYVNQERLENTVEEIVEKYIVRKLKLAERKAKRMRKHVVEELFTDLD